MASGDRGTDSTIIAVKDSASSTVTAVGDAANKAIRVSLVSNTSGGAGGGPATIADGADVAQGTTTDPAWSSGAGTVIALLKKIASAGGSAVSIADGSDAAEGITTDAAVVTDTTGTLSGKLRGLVKWAFERMPASLGQKVMGSSLPVVIASDQTAVPVSGSLTVSGTVTANAGSNLNTSALAVESGGNLATLAGKDFATQTTLAAIKTDVDKIPSQGTATSSASMPVTIASDQTVPVSAASLPLPSNAAQESNGNLDAITNFNDFRLYRLLVDIRLELRVSNHLLATMGSVKDDLDDLRKLFDDYSSNVSTLN